MAEPPETPKNSYYRLRRRRAPYYYDDDEDLDVNKLGLSSHS